MDKYIYNEKNGLLTPILQIASLLSSRTVRHNWRRSLIRRTITMFCRTA